MKKVFLVSLVLGVLFFSCTPTSTPQGSDTASKDEAFRERIIGKWAEGESPYGIASFEEGGLYKAWMYENPRKEKLLFSAVGKWWIENGRLYNTISDVTPPSPALKPGGVITDKIVEISEDIMTLIDDGGVQYSKTRIKE